jgi:hypothetical protein
VRARISRRRTVAGVLAVAAAALVVAIVLLAQDSHSPAAGRTRWSIFEDHAALVRSDPDRRERVLKELRSLGADTIRVLGKWNEIAPRPQSADRPRFDASDPADYRGFGPYDDLVRRATRLGFRILIDVAPDAPRWATAGHPPITVETVNRAPDAHAFGEFAAAVARRYSGSFRGLPAVHFFSIWNEPNHELFLKPTARAPQLYRELVRAAIPALRENGVADIQVFAGEMAPAERPGAVIGPERFLRRWLCLDERFEPVTSSPGCAGFVRPEIDGFGHHPYGPARQTATRRDAIDLLTIRRLGADLDRAAAAGRLPEDLPLYSTEFGFQSNPPDPTVSTTLARQAELLNEKEEQSYRYPRLRSYAQYLLYDDPPRPGVSEEEIWSGFQTGLRFNDGRRKPALDAYRLPISVDPSPDGGVRIWGLVRPRATTSYVQLDRLDGRRWAAVGERIATDDQGYFELSRPELGIYRFRAYERRGAAHPIGTSRSARPLAETPLAVP